MSNELTEEQMEEIWNTAKGSVRVEWRHLMESMKDDQRGVMRSAHILGRESVQSEMKERTGWTDKELKKALQLATGNTESGDITIDVASPTAHVVDREVENVRAILYQLHIAHEPPAVHPDPEKHKLIRVRAHDGGMVPKDHELALWTGQGYENEYSGWYPYEITDWSPVRVVEDGEA